MPKRSSTTTKDYLINAPLPQFTESYTVIGHEFVIIKTMDALAAKGFEVKNELYRCNHDAQIAQGIYYLNYGSDPEMGMMFAWSNSYDKSMRFKCAIGGYIFISMNEIVSGTIGSWGRKHTGSADEETNNTILAQIDSADIYYNQLVLDKENMKGVILTKQCFAEVMGRLYFEHNLLTGEQLRIVRDEHHKPSYQYLGDKDSLWCLYNHITRALKTAHPKTWMDQQRMIHWFLTKEFGIQNAIVGMTSPDVVQVLNTVTNEKQSGRQIDLEDAIVIAERENTSSEDSNN